MNQPNDLSHRRPYFWRMLRQDFLDLCDRNHIAALLLDYFYTNEVNSMGRRTQGGRDDGFYELSTAFASAVVLLDVGKNSVKAALYLLILNGFITPHPDNGRAGWQNRNRYRPNMTVILQAADDWARTHPMSANKVFQLVSPEQSIGLAEPINGSAQTNQLVQPDQSIGPTRPQDLISNQVMDQQQQQQQDAPQTEPQKELLLLPLISIFKDWAGRAPTKAERQHLEQLTAGLTIAQVEQAFADATLKGARSLKYLVPILADIRAGTHGANGKPKAAERKPFVAPDKPADVVTVEAMRQMRREIEARRRAEGGEA
jgi:hypothetical protein